MLDNFMSNDQTTSVPCIQIHELLQHQCNSLVQIEFSQYSYDHSSTHQLQCLGVILDEAYRLDITTNVCHCDHNCVDLYSSI